MALLDASVADHIRQLEERLLQPQARQSPAALDQLLSDDFVEFGSSGRVFNKQQIIESLQGERSAELNLQDFRAVALADHVILATYRSTRKDLASGDIAHALRSSIWVKLADRWQIVFHQGTRQSAT